MSHTRNTRTPKDAHKNFFWPTIPTRHDIHEPRTMDQEPQATSSKPQAPSVSRCKLEISSPKLQASSLKPQAASSLIREPWKSFTSLGPRASAKIKVFCGCATCHAIWCGENLSLLARVIFNSTVKKCP
jgi:hypothetical protein